MDKGDINEMEKDKEFGQMTNFEREVVGFQRDMEIMETEYRKRLFENRLYKWLEKRRKRGKKNG